MYVNNYNKFTNTKKNYREMEKRDNGGNFLLQLEKYGMLGGNK